MGSACSVYILRLSDPFLLILKLLYRVFSFPVDRWLLNLPLLLFRLVLFLYFINFVTIFFWFLLTCTNFYLLLLLFSLTLDWCLFELVPSWFYNFVEEEFLHVTYLLQIFFFSLLLLLLFSANCTAYDNTRFLQPPFC